MTRLLVLGNSQVGALRAAANEFSARHPEIDLGFFAAPGAIFRAGRVDGNGIFSPRIKSAADRTLVERINGGKLTCDLNAWDHIFVVGLRPVFVSTTALLSDHDILEGTRTGKPHLISKDFLTRVMNKQIDGFIDYARERLGTEHSFTFTDAPFPSPGIYERRKPSNFAFAVQQYAEHPDTSWLFRSWLDITSRKLAVAGYRFLEQPDETIEGPCLTKREYAEGGKASNGEDTPFVDHRHMNKDFGLAMLQEFVAKVLRAETRPETA